MRLGSDLPSFFDSSLVEAQTALAFVRRFYDWDWPDAEQDFRRACMLNNAYPTARQWLALHFCEAGRFEEAAQQVALAHDLDPLSLAISADIGWVSYFARDYGHSTLSHDVGVVP